MADSAVACIPIDLLCSEYFFWQQSISICIQTLTGAATYLQVNTSDSIAILKAQIASSRPAATLVALVFEGKQLEDQSTLKELGITDGGTLYLILKAAPSTDVLC